MWLNSCSDPASNETDMIAVPQAHHGDRLWRLQFQSTSETWWCCSRKSTWVQSQILTLGVYVGRLTPPPPSPMSLCSVISHHWTMRLTGGWARHFVLHHLQHDWLAQWLVQHSTSLQVIPTTQLQSSNHHPSFLPHPQGCPTVIYFSHTHRAAFVTQMWKVLASCVEMGLNWMELLLNTGEWASQQLLDTWRKEQKTAESLWKELGAIRRPGRWEWGQRSLSFYQANHRRRSPHPPPALHNAWWKGLPGNTQHVTMVTRHNVMDLKAKSAMFMAVYSVTWKTAITQSSLPPTFPPSNSSSVLIKQPRSWSSLLAPCQWSGKFLYPGCKNFTSSFAFPLQSVIMQQKNENNGNECGETFEMARERLSGCMTAVLSTTL